MYSEIGNINLNSCISSIAVSINGDYFAAGTIDQNIHIYNAIYEKIDKPIFKFDSHILGVIDVAFNREGNQMAVSSLDSIIRTWNVDEGIKIQQIQCNPMHNWQLRFYGDSIITGGQHGKIYMYHSLTSELLKQVKGYEAFITSIAISNDDKFLAVGNQIGNIFIYKMTDLNAKPEKIWIHHKAVRSLVFSPDSYKLVSASEDQYIQGFDLVSMKPFMSLSGHKGSVNCVDINQSNDKLLVSGSYDKSIRIWDIHSQSSINTISFHTSNIWSTRFSHDGRAILSGGDSGILAIHMSK